MATDSDTRSDSVMQGDIASVWRCGVSTGVEVADRVMVLMKKSRSKAAHRYADLLDEMMQNVMDARHQHKVESYQEAFKAHKEINVAAAEKLAAISRARGES